MTITIDEEFKSLIPPLSDLERLQLEENLEKDGCKDPLIIWKDKSILIDGYNRLEICERLGLEYSIREIVLADRDAVKQWMYRNQLGRRNLSPADASELRGRMYNARKKTKSEAGSKGGASKAQNYTCLKSTADEVAAETGVSAATVKRDGEYAAAVDEVAKTDPAIRSKVRQGVVKKKDVIAAAKGTASSPEKAREPESEKKAPTVDQVWRMLIRLQKDKRRHGQLVQITAEALRRLTPELRGEVICDQLRTMTSEERTMVYATVEHKLKRQPSPENTP
jgi:hypothetical protein